MKSILATLSLILLLASSASAENCTYTLGYWKNHSDVWPADGLELGNVYYTDAQLLSILNYQPVPFVANGLTILCHQLIAAKLNIAAGADDDAIESALTFADDLIGDLVCPPIGSGFLHPSVVGSLVDHLDNYNNGNIGPGHCGNPTAIDEMSWGQLRALYR